MKTYIPKGVCSKQIDFELEDGIIKEVKFYRGCDGNSKAVASLLKGMEAAKAISLLKGITCEGRPTSCADQLAKALENER